MPVNIFELSDLRTPWCIHVAATLRIAEHIAAGLDRIEAIAAAASNCDTHVLHCVLSHLVSKGVFAEPERGRFALNDAAQPLLDPTMHIGLDLDGIGGRMAHSWSTLLSYVRTGASAYHEVFGMTFWQDLDAHPHVAATFDALIGPTGHGTFNPDFPITGGWQSIRSVVDVGGGTGAMLAAILKAHPHIHGTLVDLPRTVARAVALPETAATIGQSFFDPLPAGANVYLLRGVINDWSDRDAIAILTRCAEAARPSGRVVILKSVGPDDEPRRLDIEMVLAGGKHRTVDEFQILARDAGLEIVADAQQPGGYFTVECRPI